MSNQPAADPGPPRVFPISQLTRSKVLTMVFTGRLALLFALASVALVGCDSGNPFPTVPVSGTLAYEDGTPIGGMKIYFHSQAPPKDGMHPRPASVDVGQDGKFGDITTYKYKDGLALGKHRVTLVIGRNQGENKRVPDEYTQVNNTPLEVEVTGSGQVLDIRVPKP